MLLWPLVITLGTVLVGIPVMQRRGLDSTGSRVPAGLLVAQVATVVVAWGVL